MAETPGPKTRDPAFLLGTGDLDPEMAFLLGTGDLEPEMAFLLGTGDWGLGTGDWLPVIYGARCLLTTFSGTFARRTP